ncbi:MAG: flagellar basal body P-ring formation protein FlgA [Planctomycetales bacterium]|nr:flagellar basal body P-ring formation protein FlgA [Planctomycetales bacterium]
MRLLLRGYSASLLSRAFGVAIVTATACVSVAAEVTVSVLPTARAVADVVRVADVARISTTDARLRNAIGQLDLAVADDRTDAGTLSISQQQIRLRLLLAGYHAPAVSVDGAPTSLIDVESTGDYAEQIRALLSRSLAEKLGVNESELRVRLTRDLPPSVLNRLAEQPSTFRVRSLAALMLGTRSTQIEVLTDGRFTSQLIVSYEALQRVQVLQLTEAVTRGQPIYRESIMELDEWTDGSQQYVAFEELDARVAATDLRPGHVLVNRSLRHNTPDDYAVKQRDVVRVMAIRGGLRVTLRNAEVLQNGRVGEFVQVRNPSSREVFRGRVASRQEVHVVF